MPECADAFRCLVMPRSSGCGVAARSLPIGPLACRQHRSGSSGPLDHGHAATQPVAPLMPASVGAVEPPRPREAHRRHHRDGPHQFLIHPGSTAFLPASTGRRQRPASDAEPPVAAGLHAIPDSALAVPVPQPIEAGHARIFGVRARAMKRDDTVSTPAAGRPSRDVLGGSSGAGEMLKAGLLSCPGCRDRLVRWGWARERRLSGPGRPGRMVPRSRSRCGGCKATRVLLPADLLARRADDAR